MIIDAIVCLVAVGLCGFIYAKHIALFRKNKQAIDGLRSSLADIRNLLYQQEKMNSTVRQHLEDLKKKRRKSTSKN